MPSNNRFHSTSSAAKYASKYASKAAVGLGRWATTEHTGSAKFFATMPRMGFTDTITITITIVLVHIVTTILGAIGSAFLVYLLIAYGIPALLFL